MNEWELATSAGPLAIIEDRESLPVKLSNGGKMSGRDCDSMTKCHLHEIVTPPPGGLPEFGG